MKILLVEDSKPLNDVAERALQAGGHTIHACLSFTAGLEYLARGRYDLVICDLYATGGHVREFVATALRNPETKVLLWSMAEAMTLEGYVGTTKAHGYARKEHGDWDTTLDRLLLAMEKIYPDKGDG